MTNPATPRKRDLAALLASVEPSVMYGEQTESYWLNRYMEKRLADLIARVERLEDRLTSPTTPAAVATWATWATAKFEAATR